MNRNETTLIIGDIGAGSANNKISYTHFAGAGRGLDFGDLTQARNRLGAFSSPTRGVFTGGYAPGNQTTMDYVTISQTGNAVDFGDLSANSNTPLAANSSTRGLIAGINETNVIEFITISTTGNATDFGDLTEARRGLSGFSGSHGGIGV